ncbi:hypothetical protein BY996DRAFT_79344 [Phakopsora pachyrhizi]|nr:hypothetical protein BY996DRAFT_79344 [Phakopsora pachyrhizi]
MEDVQFKINSAEQWIKESVADQLESFINSCPSTSTSSIRIFKPELFILPKRMIHHQLQTLFKSISGRAVHIDRLRLEFINEVNRQRMIEFGWREEWSKQISQLRSQLRSTCDDIRLVELGAQSIDDDFERWAVEIFKARERHDLVDLILSDDDEPPPDYLQTLESFKTDLSSSCFEMIEPATNLIKEIGCQADELVEDINQKLPPLDYLSVDLVKSLDDSKNCLKVTLQICEGIRGKIERVSLEIQARRTEHEFRKRWRAQCKEISVEDLKIINNSLSEVCNSLNDLGHNRQALRMSYQQEEIDRTSLETLFSGLLENRRSLWRIKSTDIVAIDHSLELVRVKLDMVTEESDRLSKSDLPRPYLREIKEQLDSSRKGVERCLIIENFYRSERLELEDWKNERLYTLIRKIEDENKAVESILRMSESENFDSKAWKECLKNSTPAAIHPDGSSNSSSSSSSSSPSSSCSLSLELSKEVSKLKAKINRTVGLINSVEQISSKLVEFDEADIELRKDLEHYKAILPQSCYDYLSQTLSVSTVLKELRSDREIPSADFDPIEPISKRLDELRQRSNNLLSGLNDNLKAAQSVFEHVRLRKTHLKRVLRVFGQLNDLDLRSWIDKDSKTQHSPLPTQSNLVNAISTLEDLERELNDLGDSDHSAGMELIAECWQGLSNRRDTVVMLKSFVDFSELIVECDLSFSGLLDKLDELPVGERDEGVGEARIRAFKVLTRLREASTSIDQDPRIKYQIKRLNQTWEELCEMIKDRSESSSELPYRQTQNPQNSRIPVYSRSGLKSRGLMDLENSISSLNTPPPSKSSKRSMPPSLGGRMTFNSSPVTDSPSYMISQKVGGNLRSESQSESPLQRPNSSCDFNRSTRRSSSRQGFQKFNSLNSTKVRTRLNSMQAVQSTPPSSLSQPGRINSSSGSSSSNNSFTRHKISKRSYYTPQSNRNIDQQVGKVVNQLALSVHIAPAEGWEDNSGLYWIGEKVYFCRILRSQTVMVRIGGGWNELSKSR